ncbi:scavenger receptor class B member 1-like isoform X1 [Petromyzon marinus]|uniref:scavenger receptor class B member 1-like isoform X1 n=1 Tax=Petromyzon marinus TaxID=7757 RepID=UPI003F70255A
MIITTITSIPITTTTITDTIIVGSEGRAMSLRWLCVSASAAVCLALGVLSLVYFRQIMRRELEKVRRRLSLREDGGETFRAWHDVPVPFYLSVYLYHVDNPEDIVQRGDKPRVTQRGPYTYREERHKVDLRFYDLPAVSFRERRVYQFCPELSVGSERDSITTLNIPALAAAMLSERLSPRLRLAVSLLLSAVGEGSAVVSLAVGDFLWGYSDPLARALHSLSPTLWPSPRFGLLAGFNNSDSGEFVVETGVTDISQVHRVVSWNGMTKLPYWRSARCNQISGTAGEMWPPLVNQSLPLTFFSPDTCR